MTSLLVSAEVGGEQVWDRLVPLVYHELRGMAHAQLVRDNAATLATTELVHEAYLRLVDGARVIGQGRSYFFGAAARAMRQVLVDHARRRRRLKRGGGGVLTLRTADLVHEARAYDLVALDLALDRLNDAYPRAAKVVECRFFGGLSTEETSDVLRIAPRTVKRDWAFARAWLYRDLTGAVERRAEGAG